MPLPPLALAVVGGSTALAALFNIFVVPVGHVGVKSTLGVVYEHSVPPGLHLKNPLSHVYKSDVRTQIEECSHISVLTSEGLSVTFQFGVVYHVTPEGAVQLYKTAGIKWQDKLLRPQIRATIRNVVAGRSAKQLYDSAGREMVASEMLAQLNSVLAARGVVVESIPLRTITLPDRLVAAIEDKLRMEQENERMQFVLEKERAEAQRKAIEANGIAEFQRVVSNGISKELLSWKGIEATERLAESPNTKIIVIGNDGTGGLPLILGGG